MRKFKLPDVSHQKSAFVLSGGVVKAACWHLGVAKAMQEFGFKFSSYDKVPDDDLVIDTYVGSSAGTLIALYLASGYSPQEVIQSQFQNKKGRLKPITYKTMLSLERPLKKPKAENTVSDFPRILRAMIKPLYRFDGFFSTYGLRNYLLNDVLPSNNFEDFKPDLFIVGTQLDQSEKSIFSKYHYPSPIHDNTAHYVTGVSIADAAGASMSVPPFYAPYPIQHPKKERVDYYIDGEIRETLSSHAAIDNGCKLLVCSWTHTPYHFKEEIGSLVNYGLPNICVQAIFLMIQKKIVANRARLASIEDMIYSVDQYLKEEKMSDIHRKKIIKIIEAKMDYKRDVRIIDIFPDHHNSDMFFLNHFSLKTDVTRKIVRIAYEKALRVLDKHS